MATNKAANRAPAPKTPERKRVKDYTCKGCGHIVSSRKSLSVMRAAGEGFEKDRYCTHCAAP